MLHRVLPAHRERYCLTVWLDGEDGAVNGDDDVQVGRWALLFIVMIECRDGCYDWMGGGTTTIHTHHCSFTPTPQTIKNNTNQNKTAPSLPGRGRRPPPTRAPPAPAPRAAGAVPPGVRGGVRGVLAGVHGGGDAGCVELMCRVYIWALD